MDRNIYAKFLNTVKKNALLDNCDRIVVGLSGGADSVCLLLLLCELRKQGDLGRFEILALHFNHCIRGKEADDDEMFCKDLCKALGIEFLAERADVPLYASENKLSTEEAARELRYGFFGNIAKLSGDRIAVAHNTNDRAETVLYNIARGTSIEGLKGIGYKRGKIIRPVLDLTREETEAVCRDFGIEYRVDSTNSDGAYTRNKIRNEILPYLNNAFGIDFSESLLRLSELASEENDYLKRIAREEFPGVSEVLGDGTVKIIRKELLLRDEVIAKRILRIALASVLIKGKMPFKDGVGIDRKMTERIFEYIRKNSGGGFVIAAKDVVCVKKGNHFYLGDRGLLIKENPLESVECPGNHVSIFKDGKLCCDGEFVFTVGNGASYNVLVRCIDLSENIGDSSFINDLKRNSAVIFDLGEVLKSKAEIVLRTAMSGDYFVPFKAKGGKPLRRFFTDCKISVEERYALPLLAVGNDILHVFNVRRSNFAPVQGGKACVIMVKITKAED